MIAMKKMLVLSMLSLLGGTAVFANEVANSQSGGGMQTFDGTKPIYDSSEVEGGRGWWRRGHDGSRNISEYQDYSLQGHASCENGNGTFSNGPWVPAYSWSKSSVGWTSLGGNKAYYNYR